ncbi:DMT family transporter [Brachyspira hyodysenteriae]|uniref:DMT family transporter n=1 Tax=Brachyspira hyodysenteriae TaxID=159 RepID=UPI001ADDB85F|nr:DMT family transporter [Brachyspira hyodysenteriae]MCZ9838572.1 DMT family transporter [Brachyspira hyodysenteriae]MCZ9847873.1 DMT family transporter [Brachyspira hyodysenteriae]MCZ9851700.1 DMT family transporter [Brachyspira hyodysenteriae]MCZ9859561.1 DMT family transporter [Brachyspira hyodysenteriae]MCZ9870165.1 DMT family transporter [Brachyspira hyodysenteriae]
MKKFIPILPILSGIFWGGGGIFIRRLMELNINSFTVVSSRVIVASIIFFICVFLYDRSLIKIKLKDLWIFVSAGILGILGLNICYNEAVKQLSLSLSAVLLSLSPIFVLIFANIFFKEKITVKKVICMILALLGCFFASGVLETNETMKWTYFGIFIGFMGAFFYGLYSIFSKLAIIKNYNTLTVTLYALISIAVISLPFTDWKALSNVVVGNGSGMLVFMLFHSLCTSVFPYAFFTIALGHMDAGKASILASGEPIAAMFFGIFFYHEIPTVLSVVGVLLTLTALTLLSLPEKNK